MGHQDCSTKAAQLYATNAKWPVANAWHIKPGLQHPKHRDIPHQELIACKEWNLKQQSKRLRHQMRTHLFISIVQVTDLNACRRPRGLPDIQHALQKDMVQLQELLTKHSYLIEVLVYTTLVPQFLSVKI
jgi:hypothetical protein